MPRLSARFIAVLPVQLLLGIDNFAQYPNARLFKYDINTTLSYKAVAVSGMSVIEAMTPKQGQTVIVQGRSKPSRAIMSAEVQLPPYGGQL